MRIKKFYPLALVIVLFSSILLTPGLSFAGWILKYHHDAGGNPVAGSLADLIDAIENGADVKSVVCTDKSTPTTSYKHNLVYIDWGDELDNNDDFVVAQFHKFGLLAIKDANNKIIGTEDMFHKRITLTTNGDITVLRGQPNAPLGDFWESTICLKWYVFE